MKKLLIIMIALALIAGVSVNEAKADPSIAVTVTMAFVDVSVSPNVWNIVTILPDGTAELAVVATNGGNVDEAMTISMNLAGTSWTAGATPGPDQFRMEFDLENDSGFPGTVITTGDTALADPVSPGTQDFHLLFTAPTANNVTTTQQDITVTVSATAS